MPVGMFRMPVPIVDRIILPRHGSRPSLHHAIRRRSVVPMLMTGGWVVMLVTGLIVLPGFRVLQRRRQAILLNWICDDRVIDLSQSRLAG